MKTRRPQPIDTSRSASLHQLVDSTPPVSDYILLCCFGPDLADTRHHRQLHAALQHAGYAGSLARHLIRTSPLLTREANRRYRLKHQHE